MSWQSEKKKQFEIYILNSDIDQCVAIKTVLQNEGFEARMFTEENALLQRALDVPPHLVIFFRSALSSELQGFVQKIVDISSETLFLPVCAVTDTKDFLPYRDFNFVGMCFDGEGYLSRLAWMTDQALKGIYFLYQNEKLIENMEKKDQDVEKIKSESDKVRLLAEQSSGIQLSEEFKKYQHVSSKEDVIETFLREMHHHFLAKNNRTFSIYFKFLPSVMSFVATKSYGIEVDSISGVGGQLTASDLKDPVDFIQKGQVPKMVHQLMAEGFSVHDFIFKPVFLDHDLDGFFVFWSNTQKLYNEEFDNLFSLFYLFYEKAHLSKRIKSLEISDPVTEFHTREYYHRILKDEVTRARRLQKAVSVVKLAIDHLLEFEQVVGKSGKDQVLRLMAQLIKKTSRVNDVSCRLAENEFALIMPHAARKGATIRAERLRRMIESQIFQNIGQKVTVSLGVSEYPTFCSSSDDLDKSASQALGYVADKGGNKVCLFSPTKNFQPDFQVPAL